MPRGVWHPRQEGFQSVNAAYPVQMSLRCNLIEGLIRRALRWCDMKVDFDGKAKRRYVSVRNLCKSKKNMVYTVITVDWLLLYFVR